MNGAKLQGFEQSSSAALGSDYTAAAYERNRGLLVERLQQAVPPQRTPRGLMDIMNSALTRKTNHNDFERSWGTTTIRFKVGHLVPTASPQGKSWP